MDRSHSTALRHEAELHLRRELESRFPDLAAVCDLRLTDRLDLRGSEARGESPEFIDW
jgi:hypothetical protein